MTQTSRRSLLAAAALAASAGAVPVRAQVAEMTGEGDAQLFASRRAAMKARIARDVRVLYCAGYAAGGDRGAALYVRADDDSGFGGGFRSADGGWWDLAENALNPFMFGAKGDLKQDDSPAIQAMFDYAVARKQAYPLRFEGGRFYLKSGLTLPTVPLFQTMDIDGGGALLFTDQSIAIFSRLPVSQDDAIRLISQSHWDIHNFVFRGTGKAGQVGMHLGATFSNVVRECVFETLEYGSIASFCLASAWRDNLYHKCTRRALVLQSGTGYDQGAVWPGAREPDSPCNVSVIENCRVFGSPGQTSAFGIFGSDAIRMNGCIAEGHGDGIDVHFDYQGSPTVKHFYVSVFHCEAPAKLNFKVRSSGIVSIDGIIRSIPSAIYDARGSINCEVFLKNVAWIGEMPAPGGPDKRNPNGRWFYHSDGGGHGGVEGGTSNGTQWRFEDWPPNAWKQLSEPAVWEGGTLPAIVHVRGMHVNGVMEWSNNGSSFKSPIHLADGSSLRSLVSGVATSPGSVVPAQSSVTETIAAAGLTLRHTLSVHPANAASVPPDGIAWNSWIEADGAFRIRYTNVASRPIALQRGAEWRYAASASR